MATGSIVTHLSTSYALVPIQDAIVTFSQRSPLGFVEVLPIRVSDENGQTEPVEFTTPPFSESQTPQEEQPWINVDIAAEHPSFNRVIVQNVQVFADTVTDQDIMMVPQDQFPELLVRTNVYEIPPFNL